MDARFERYIENLRTVRTLFYKAACFHAEITLKKDNLVFFSVPYDDGFTAYVNGNEADIVRVDEGLMAVLAPAGENTIDFVYQADGYSLAGKVSLAALAVFVLYAGYFVWKKKKRC